MPKELSRISNPFKWLTVTYLRHFISSGLSSMRGKKYGIWKKIYLYKMKCTEFSTFKCIAFSHSHLEMSSVNSMNLTNGSSQTNETFQFYMQPLNSSQNDIGLRLNIAIASMAMQFSLLKFDFSLCVHCTLYMKICSPPSRSLCVFVRRIYYGFNNNRVFVFSKLFVRFGSA